MHSFSAVWDWPTGELDRFPAITAAHAAWLLAGLAVFDAGAAHTERQPDGEPRPRARWSMDDGRAAVVLRHGGGGPVVVGHFKHYGDTRHPQRRRTADPAAARGLRPGAAARPLGTPSNVTCLA
jgi:hypothetical protein